MSKADIFEPHKSSSNSQCNFTFHACYNNLTKIFVHLMPLIGRISSKDTVQSVRFLRVEL